MNRKQQRWLTRSIPVLAILAIMANADSLGKWIGLDEAPAEPSQPTENVAERPKPQIEEFTPPPELSSPEIPGGYSGEELEKLRNELDRARNGMRRDPTRTLKEQNSLRGTPNQADLSDQDSSTYKAPRAQIILIKKSGNLANIDGTIVRVGSEFMGGKVVAIEETHVEVNLAGKKWRIYPEGRNYVPRDQNPRAVPPKPEVTKAQ